MTMHTPNTASSLTRDRKTTLRSSAVLNPKFGLAISSVRYLLNLTVTGSLGLRCMIFDYQTSAQPKPARAGTEKPTYLVIKEYSAKVPPSPSSSANSTIVTYLIVTTIVRDQMMSESAPIRSSFEGGSGNVDENTYKGLVPMSPYITPTD